MLALTQRLLDSGYRNCRHCAAPGQELSAFFEPEPDLIVLSPDLLENAQSHALTELQAYIRASTGIPVLLAGENMSSRTRRRALGVGVTDFLNEPADPVAMITRVRNLLDLRFACRALAELRQKLESAPPTDTAEQEALASLHLLARCAEYREDPSGHHTVRVGRLSASISAMLGWSEEETNQLCVAAMLHDLGKITVPESILLKPGQLTNEEFDLLKKHTTAGRDLLGSCSSGVLALARDVALSHHEGWNGSGYPFGLAGEEISPAGRIVAVADVFDALTHDRPYRKAFSVDVTVGLIQEDRGKAFDPAVVDAFLEVARRDDISALVGEEDVATSPIIERFLDETVRTRIEQSSVPAEST